MSPALTDSPTLGAAARKRRLNEKTSLSAYLGVSAPVKGAIGNVSPQ